MNSFLLQLPNFSFITNHENLFFLIIINTFLIKETKNNEFYLQSPL